jgi:hypothetical protein
MRKNEHLSFIEIRSIKNFGCPEAVKVEAMLKTVIIIFVGSVFELATG